VTSVSLAGTGAEADKTSDLEARLAAAEAKIAQLTTADQDNWLTEQRADEIRGVVQDVLADADTRASLLTQGVTAGYDNGAVLGSSDGNWLLRTNLLMQQRWVWNNQDDADGLSDGSDESISGFENTRTKFIMQGHVVSPDWFFRVDHDVSNGYGRGGTTNAFLGYDYGNGWKVKMGSMKAPFLREELVESQNQLAVERSTLNYGFTGGYVDGLAFSQEADQYRFTFAYTDGAGSGQSTWGTYDTEWAFTGRFEYLASGNWNQFEDFTSPQGSEQAMMFGVAIHYQQDEFGTGPGGAEVETLAFTLDASIEGDGWNVYGAYMSADMDDDTTGGVDMTPQGFLIQGGFYIAEDMEIYGRYEWGDPDATGVEDLGLITFGVTKYFAGHNLKWSTDLVYGIDEIDSSWSGMMMPAYGLSGLRADESGEDGQYALRTQLQLLF
jgi:hypothetical protein